MSDDGPAGALPPHHAANSVRARRLGIDTQYEAIVFMHKECRVCRSEGFAAHTRVLLKANGRKSHRHALSDHRARWSVTTRPSCPESAWKRLGLKDGERITISHPPPLNSLSHLRSRIYGNDLSEPAFHAIIGDIVDGQYSDIHLSSFLTACASPPLNHLEVLALTHAMVEAGDRLKWPAGTVADKHSVGGLPGNRTTPIIVSIVAALGMMMPKTSSRAITSPAGTADTMETMAPVDLDNDAIRRVVEREAGCIVWGGAINLSPADDILIRVERALDIDSEGQMIASVLSKKIAAGSTHVVLDHPRRPDRQGADRARRAAAVRRIGQCRRRVRAEDQDCGGRRAAADRPRHRSRARGPRRAESVCAAKPTRRRISASARLRWQQPCWSSLKRPPRAAAKPSQPRCSTADGPGANFSASARPRAGCGPRRSRASSVPCSPSGRARCGRSTTAGSRALAKLAGAPDDKAAGVDMHVRVGDAVTNGQPLCTVHADSPGELAYAFDFAEANRDIIAIGEM